MVRSTRALSAAASVFSALTLSALLHAAAGTSPVADAAQQMNGETVRALIKQGADVNLAQGDGMTALHWAALHGDVALAQALIAAGASVTATTRINNYTPLFLASQYGSGSVVGTLLSARANPNAVSATGSTPLMLAAASGQVDAVKLLLDGGAEVNAKESSKDQTAVMFAAAYDQAAVIKLLAARGADLESTTKVVDLFGLTKDNGPVRQAPGVDRDYQYTELVGYLGGLTPLLFAARDGYMESVHALLEAGADINHTGTGSHTSPLLMAIINGHFDLAMSLLERGADPNLAGENGVAPLYAVVNSRWAQKTFHNQLRARLQQRVTYLDLMKTLIAKGGDPNARVSKKVWYSEFNKDQSNMNEAGATPFWRAAYACDVDALRLLVAQGADPDTPTIKPPEGRRGYRPDGKDFSGLPPIPAGAPSVTPLLAAAGVGHGRGGGGTRYYHLAGCMPAAKYLVEELGADVNARDHDGDGALHYAAARGDNEMILYLVSKGADVKAVNRAGQTIADMANGPTERGVPPFRETLALLETLGVKPNNKCVLCS